MRKYYYKKHTEENKKIEVDKKVLARIDGVLYIRNLTTMKDKLVGNFSKCRKIDERYYVVGGSSEVSLYDSELENFILKNVYDIKPFKEIGETSISNIVVVRNLNYKYGLFNLDCKKHILPCEYLDISSSKNNFCFIKEKNNFMYIYDVLANKKVFNEGYSDLEWVDKYVLVTDENKILDPQSKSKIDFEFDEMGQVILKNNQKIVKKQI